MEMRTAKKDFDAASLGEVERRLLVGVLDVDLRAVLEQNLNEALILFGDCQMQSRLVEKEQE